MSHLGAEPGFKHRGTKLKRYALVNTKLNSQIHKGPFFCVEVKRFFFHKRQKDQ